MSTLTDQFLPVKGIFMETVKQLRAARAALGQTRDDLAKASGVSVETIKRMEGGTGKLAGNVSTIAALRAALESEGVIFVAENGGPAGVRFTPTE